ncbi:hypothetical protein EJ04DRAFT_256100 [Polyplosphaeria fusca]|uniref:Uncharacterized protein n=1 Tax=Polyplosphaeria fusca TaxID=682080 RepID=A0A9P4V2D8_9PLEO|nr:hypothetical protein EJ04DRAFT_256100 [Polyplosphaeria fusca]
MENSERAHRQRRRCAIYSTVGLYGLLGLWNPPLPVRDCYIKARARFFHAVPLAASNKHAARKQSVQVKNRVSNRAPGVKPRQHQPLIGQPRSVQTSFLLCGSGSMSPCPLCLTTSSDGSSVARPAAARESGTHG